MMNVNSIPSTDLVSHILGNNDIDVNMPIFVDADNVRRFYTKADVLVRTRLLIGGLRHLNGGCYPVAKSICVVSNNDIECPIYFLAIVGAGACYTGANPSYTRTELARHLKLSSPALIITELRHLVKVLAAIELLSMSAEHIIVVHRAGHKLQEGLISYNTLFDHGEADWLSFNHAGLAKEAIAVMSSTSGTDGLTKMAIRSHYNLSADDTAWNGVGKKHYRVRRLIALPMFHAFASPLCHLRALREGVMTFIMRRFEAQLFVDALSSHQITETAVVPSMLQSFRCWPLERQEMLKSLRLIWCGGAPLTSRLQNAVSQILDKDCQIMQVWGMTECGWVTTFQWPERDDTGSVGRLLPGFEAKIVDDSGRPFQDQKQRGEILLKGPTIMVGYEGSGRACSSHFDREGWFLTGDIAYIDKGKVYIVGRKKDLIKVRGWQVSPVELEDVALLHAEVKDCAVIGLWSADMQTEIPLVICVPMPGSRLTETVLCDYLLRYLARYKVADCQVGFRQQIPRNSSGKVNRTALRAEAAGYIAQD